METIFDGDDLEVRFHERGGGEVWTAFGSADLQPFAADFLERRGLTAALFVPKSPHWYQRPCIWPALRQVRARLGSRLSVTYGSSMGGFAALAFGRELRADVCIAAAPQVSVHRDIAPFDTRYDPVVPHWQRADARTGLCGRVALIYDPGQPEDAAHAALIPAAERVLVHGAEHHALEPLRRSGVLGDTIMGLAHKHQTCEPREGLSRNAFRSIDTRVKVSDALVP